MNQPYKTLAQRDAEYRTDFDKRNKDGQKRLWRLLKKMINIAIEPYHDGLIDTKENFQARLQYAVDEQVKMWENLSLTRYTQLHGGGSTIIVKVLFYTVHLEVNDVLKTLMYGALTGNFIHVNDIVDDFVLNEMTPEPFKAFIQRLYEN